MFLVLEGISLLVGRKAAKEGVMFDAILPKAFAFVFRIEEEFHCFFVIAAVVVVVVQLYEKSFPFEGEFPENIVKRG